MASMMVFRVSRSSVRYHSFTTPSLSRAPATSGLQFKVFGVSMFTAQQIIIGGGLLVLTWAVVHGLMCHGGHRKSINGTKKR